MKTSSLIHLASVAFVASLRGAGYETTFDSFANPGEVAGNDQWTINEPTPNVSFIATWNASTPSSNAAALGGLFDVPTVATVELKHPFGSTLGQTSVSFVFTIVDSTDDFPDRDTFEIRLANGNKNVFSLTFTPNAQTANPKADTSAQSNLSYVAGEKPPVSLSIGVLEGGTYALDLSFTPNGASTDFTLKLTHGTSETQSGTVTLDPSSAVTDFGLVWKPTKGPANSGDNYFLMDNLRLVSRPDVQPPVLKIEPSAEGVVISWPSSNTGFALEARSELGSGNWEAVTTQPTSTGGRFSLPLVASGSTKFYRLRLP